jgi:hypothetical protein
VPVYSKLAGIKLQKEICFFYKKDNPAADKISHAYVIYKIDNLKEFCISGLNRILIFK